MAITLKQSEAIPATYPPAPAGLSAAAAALDPAMIWQRIEAYTAHRFTARSVVWTVEGAGSWEFPLSPATVTGFERWAGSDWEIYIPAIGPWGYDMQHDGTYRITADVGGGALPAAVSGAFKRLAEYMADSPDRAGVSNYSVNMGGAIEESYQRNPAWLARAMDLSGAGDLLRQYRRA